MPRLDQCHTQHALHTLYLQGAIYKIVYFTKYQLVSKNHQKMNEITMGGKTWSVTDRDERYAYRHSTPRTAGRSIIVLAVKIKLELDKSDVNRH